MRRLTQFYIYLSYRVYRLYNGTLPVETSDYDRSSRWDVVVGVLISFNISLIANVLMRLLIMVHMLYPGWQGVGEFLASIDLILFFATVIGTSIFITIKRKLALHAMSKFNDEPDSVRVRRGWGLLLYVVVSLVLVVVSIFW